jgi:hypothetical protein
VVPVGWLVDASQVGIFVAIVVFGRQSEARRPCLRLANATVGCPGTSLVVTML